MATQLAEWTSRSPDADTPGRVRGAGLACSSLPNALGLSLFISKR